MSGDQDKMSFEQALHGLEEIVARLEQGEVELEEAMELFERGSGLAESCSERLAHAEQRLEELEPAAPQA